MPAKYLEKRVLFPDHGEPDRRRAHAALRGLILERCGSALSLRFPSSAEPSLNLSRETRGSAGCPDSFHGDIRYPISPNLRCDYEISCDANKIIQITADEVPPPICECILAHSYLRRFGLELFKKRGVTARPTPARGDMEES